MNYLKLIEELDSVDLKIETILSKSTNRQFAIFHPSLSYFARDYGLQQLSLEQNGKSMAPRTMQQAIDEAVVHGVVHDVGHSQSLSFLLDFSNLGLGVLGYCNFCVVILDGITAVEHDASARVLLCEASGAADRLHAAIGAG